MASLGHGGQGGFPTMIFSGIVPPRGRPSKGGGVHHNGKLRSWNSLSLNIMRVARLRASPRHGGAGGFPTMIFSGIVPPRGRPSKGGGVHRDGKLRSWNSLILNVMRVTCLRASPRHGGTGGFPTMIFSGIVPPRGRPSGGGGVHHKRRRELQGPFNSDQRLVHTGSPVRGESHENPGKRELNP